MEHYFAKSSVLQISGQIRAYCWVDIIMLDQSNHAVWKVSKYGVILLSMCDLFVTIRH